MSVVAADELPTLATGFITWGDSEPDTPFDLTQDTPQGATGSVSLTFAHVYASSGSYQVTLQVANPVSRVNVTKTVCLCCVSFYVRRVCVFVCHVTSSTNIC